MTVDMAVYECNDNVDPDYIQNLKMLIFSHRLNGESRSCFFDFPINLLNELFLKALNNFLLITS